MILDRIRQFVGLRGPKRLVLFHHLPKCGGTSMVETLRQWFPVVTMYRRAWTETPPPAPPLNSLRDSTVLVGHFELPGCHWTEIYPEALTNPDIKVMTFLREPLELQGSLFRYERKHCAGNARTFEEHLTLRPNYMASLLRADEANWREVLDRYWFVGATERAQEGFDALAEALGKPRVDVARTNETAASEESDPRHLPSHLVAAFREANGLDYRIYAEVERRFERFWTSLQTPRRR